MTRQSIELERFSIALQIQQGFDRRFETNFFPFGFGFSWGLFSRFWPLLLGPGHPISHFLLKIFLKTRLKFASLEPLIDLLANLELKL